METFSSEESQQAGDLIGQVQVETETVMIIVNF